MGWCLSLSHQLATKICYCCLRCKLICMMVTGKILVPLRHFITQTWELPRSQYQISGMLSRLTVLQSKITKLHICQVLQFPLAFYDVLFAFNLNAASMTVLLQFIHNLDICHLRRFLMLMLQTVLLVKDVLLK